ncbi:MAG TPA: T9SS type A sorting domain-containing protein [Fibrella sp.]
MKQTLLILSMCFAAAATTQAQNVQQRPAATRQVFSNTSAVLVDAVKADASIDVQAVEQITATNVTERASTATYTAGKAILLQPGFEARAGSVFAATVTPVSARATEPASDLTASAWPNPFQDQTTVEYKLPASTTVKHTLIDATGSVIRQNTSGDVQEAGVYKFGVDGNSLPVGVYIYQLQTGTQTKTIRLLKK